MLDKVQKLTGAKVVTHTMDDWPSAIYKDKFLSPFLRYMVNRKFTHNLRKASLRLGISEAMAEEFEKRYKLPFSYFHNPVNCDEFNNVEYKKIAGQHTIVYAGRIGIASNDAIAEFSQCVAELRKEGHNIIFKIYTNLQSEGLDRSKFNFDGTDLCASLKDDNHVQRISEADLLLYPVDFSDESIQYIRLSFPTKLPSYFSSGVPVFCYGPENVYSIKFVSKKNLGFVCAQHTIADLKKVLLSALNDPNLKSKYAETARKYAFDNFDKTIVRERFHNELKKVYLNARTE
jgi:glycosyltransferase involved in cell wall biosynthesis